MATTNPNTSNVTTGGTTASSLSEWAGPYVTNMLGQGYALSQEPYQVYQGPLTAGVSPLQAQAFQGIGGLSVPSSISSAATTAGNVASQAGGMSYSPTTFNNPYTTPAKYTGTNFTNQYTAPDPYTSTTDFTSQYTAPDKYDPTKFTTDLWSAQQAQQYMNPFLQTALDPQLRELSRQSDITRLGDALRLNQAGAYGGARQGIMEAEARRNLLGKQSDVLAEGYKTAYDLGQTSFKSDQDRLMEAQRQSEASRQFGYGKEMDAAALAAQYGLSGQQAKEAAAQFGYGKKMDAAQLAAQYARDVQRDLEASKQFGYGKEMDAAEVAARYGLDTAKATEASKQFGAQYGLDTLAAQLNAAKAQAELGLTDLGAQKDVLKTMLDAGTLQRGIEQEGITADYNEFLAQRDDPIRRVQFLQSLLQGLPIGTTTSTPLGDSTLSQTMQTAGGLMDLYERLFGTTPRATTAPTPTPTPT